MVIINIYYINNYLIINYMSCNSITNKSECTKNDKCTWCLDKYYYDICTDNHNDCYDEDRINKIKNKGETPHFNTLYETIYNINNNKTLINIIIGLLFFIIIVIYLIAVVYKIN